MRLECPKGFRWLRWNEYGKEGDRYLDSKTRKWVLLGKGQHQFRGEDFTVAVIRPKTSPVIPGTRVTKVIRGR